MGLLLIAVVLIVVYQIRAKASEDMRRRMGWASVVGGVVGALGFAGGFFGPMIFMPSSNQGPLLGIFITGPLGFVVGWLLGMIFYTRK